MLTERIFKVNNRHVFFKGGGKARSDPHYGSSYAANLPSTNYPNFVEAVGLFAACHGSCHREMPGVSRLSI